MSSQPRVTLIVAGNYRQFLNWCHDNYKSPYDRYIRYINNLDLLKGFRPDQVHLLLIGTWEQGPLFSGRYRRGMDHQLIEDYIELYGGTRG